VFNSEQYSVKREIKIKVYDKELRKFSIPSDCRCPDAIRFMTFNLQNVVRIPIHASAVARAPREGWLESLLVLRHNGKFRDVCWWKV
jgi:hypothetical protein